MINITQTDYIDFISKSGISKLTKVKALVNRPEYHPSFDFYKKLRDEIIDTLKLGKKKTDLLNLVSQVPDRKKHQRYQHLIERFTRFLGRKKIQWFNPPSTAWSYKDLGIKMNPELGLDINGEKFIIKLYFKDTPLKKKDIKVLLWMMTQSLCEGIFKGYKCALLDIEKGKIFEYEEDESSIISLVEGEADYFIRLWNDLIRRSA